jgi:hypothetical protein
MGWVEVLRMPEVRFARRCWVYMGGAEDYEDEVVVRVGDVYVVGTVDDLYVVPARAVRRLLGEVAKRRGGRHLAEVLTWCGSTTGRFEMPRRRLKPPRRRRGL